MSCFDLYAVVIASFHKALCLINSNLECSMEYMLDIHIVQSCHALKMQARLGFAVVFADDSKHNFYLQSFYHTLAHMLQLVLL